MIAASQSSQTFTAQSEPETRAQRIASGEHIQAPRLRTALGVLGLLAVLFGTFMVAAGAASAPSPYVPASAGGWPAWLAGPLRGLGVGIDSARFQTFTLIMFAGYVLVLLTARALPGAALGAAILLAHLLLVAGPVLISRDVFGYLAFARLGALHGLDPYTHFAAERAGDSVFGFLGWPFQHSPYGPLFTLASYATAPLGLAGGLWAMKAVMVSASLAGVALTASAAGRLGGSSRAAAAFVGLNPVLLVLAVGGDHNDTLIMAALAGALLLSAGADPRLRAAATSLVAGVGVKVTAGLALVFLLLAPADWRARLRVLSATGVGLILLGIVALMGFGSHAFGFTSAVSEQQRIVATHSIPAETARLFGLRGTPAWWRHLFIGAFVLGVLFALWRTARGSDWRTAAGWSTLGLLFCTAWLLPWYVIWALPLAAVSRDRRLYVATLMFSAYALAIHLPAADFLLSPKH